MRLGTFLIAAAACVVMSNVAVSETYTINTAADEVIDDGICSLREALTAAFSQTQVDSCPAGDADTNTINLLTSVGTYNFNSGVFAVPAGTVPSLAINANAADASSRPVINLGLNNRFLLWPDFVDEELSINRVTFFFGDDADDLGGGAIKLEGESMDDESTLARLNILETTFLSNQADADGGALHLTGEINVVILNSLFQGNSGESGGAVYFNNSGLSRGLTIRGTDFVSNTSNNGEGALYASMDTLNSPTSGGYPRVSISDIHFNQNTANGLGGIAGMDLAVKHMEVIINDSTFIDNTGSGLSVQMLENTQAERPFDALGLNRLEFKDSFINTLGPGVFQMHIIRTGFENATGTFPRVSSNDVLMYQTGMQTAGGVRVVDDMPLAGINRQVTLNGWTLVGHATAVVSFHPAPESVQIVDSILYNNNVNTAGDSSVDLNNNLIDTDPLFETAYGTDFYPGVNSPALEQSNAANFGFPNNQFQKDMLDHPRVVGSFKDLGAIERQSVNALTVRVSGQGTVELFGGSFSDCDASLSPCFYDVPSEIELSLIGRNSIDPENAVWLGHCLRVTVNGTRSDCFAGNMIDDTNEVEVYFDDVIFKSGFE